MRDGFILDRDPSGIRVIEQTENIKQRAFAAAGRTDHGVDRAALELERHPAQRVDPRIFLAEIAFDPFAAQRNFGFHGF